MTDTTPKVKRTPRKAKPDATEILRRAIETGRLLPSQRLVETELAEWLGVNRVLVKFALGKLEQEGLVESEPNRGARVRVISEQEAFEILQVRTVLESLIAREAARRAKPADHKRLRAIIATLKEALKKQDFTTYSSTNGLLHSEIRTISGHGTATRVLRSLNSHIVRFQFRTALFPGRLDHSLKEHEAIVEAICANDIDGAEAAMRDHLTNVSDTLGRILDTGKQLKIGTL